MLRHAVLPSLVILSCAFSATATTVFINQLDVVITDIDTLTLDAKCRVSSVNFDQSLDSGCCTQNVVGGANNIRTNLVNVAVLNDRTYGFILFSPRKPGSSGPGRC